MSASVEYLRIVAALAGTTVMIIAIRGFFEIRKIQKLMRPFVERLDHTIGASMYSKLKSLDEISFAINRAGVPAQLTAMFAKLQREGYSPATLGYVLNTMSRHQFQWWIGAAPAPLPPAYSITMITEYGDLTWGLGGSSERSKNDS